ncbi:MAG: OmpA family protein [Chlorobi bacterium]|nr:OmpA family protein [Chlorobiota bacterium]
MTRSQYLSLSQKLFLAVFLLSLSLIIKCQNLIPNGGFEKFINCPETYTEYSSQNIINNWIIPAPGTPDYFNECSNVCGIPTNWVGESNTHTGKGYIGLMTRFSFNGEQLENKREYLQTKLLKKLKKDELYLVKFYTKSASSALYYTDAIGIYLGNTPITKTGWSNFFAKPQIRNLKGRILNNKNFWTEICVLYKAKGDEEYLTIGNFEDNQSTLWEKAKPEELWYGELHEFAYYYIDDVSLVKVENDSACNCEEPIFNQLAHNYFARIIFNKRILGDTLVYNQDLIMNKVYFDFNKSELKPESYESLDFLITLLNKNNWQELTLSGYTDSVGTEDYNYTLSLERAKSVRNYLIQKGIEVSKINYKGMGSRNPVSTFPGNYTRAMNRRVEIRITGK